MSPLKFRNIFSFSGYNEGEYSQRPVFFAVVLKVHKIEISFGFDFEICIISLLVM
jgi:hypothetical protein